MKPIIISVIALFAFLASSSAEATTWITNQGAHSGACDTAGLSDSAVTTMTAGTLYGVAYDDAYSGTGFAWEYKTKGSIIIENTSGAPETLTLTLYLGFGSSFFFPGSGYPVLSSTPPGAATTVFSDTLASGETRIIPYTSALKFLLAEGADFVLTAETTGPATCVESNYLTTEHD